MDQIYSGAVRVKIRQANKIHGAANSNCPCFRYSKYEVPTFTKKRMASKPESVESMMIPNKTNSSGMIQ